MTDPETARAPPFMKAWDDFAKSLGMRTDLADGEPWGP